MKLQDVWSLVKQSFQEWSEDKASRLAAAMSYYTVFSIPPLILIAIAIAGYFFDQSRAQTAILNQMEQLIGDAGTTVVEEILTSAENETEEGIIASIVGVVTLVLGASGVFGQLHDALNTIWEVQPKPGRGILATIRDRFLSFTMVLGVGFLLLVSLIVSTILSGMEGYISGLLPSALVLARILNFIISFGVITVLFALIYKVVPDVEVAWKDVAIGAAVTAVLFTIGKWAIGFYLGNSAPGSTFGAFGSLVVLFVWVYYSAQILFLGAEFTQVYANNFGSRIVADEDAIALTEEARIQQGIPRQGTVAHRQGVTEGEEVPAPPSLRYTQSELARTATMAVPPIPAARRERHSETYQTMERGMEKFHKTMVAVLAVFVAVWPWRSQPDKS